MKAFVFVVVVLLAACDRQPAQPLNAPAAATTTPVVRPNEIEIGKDNDTSMKPVKKPINVKLKRSFKGEYSWDIVGTDVKEMIKTNRELQNEFPN
ncbi:MAG: hypothetical protein HQK99_07060 [Nitrospirae bacterium]|nr:hypothetical protein [Nitrospirota bacterium]